MSPGTQPSLRRGTINGRLPCALTHNNSTRQGQSSKGVWNGTEWAGRVGSQRWDLPIAWVTAYNTFRRRCSLLTNARVIRTLSPHAVPMCGVPGPDGQAGRQADLQKEQIVH